MQEHHSHTLSEGKCRIIRLLTQFELDRSGVILISTTHNHVYKAHHFTM